MVHFSAIAIVSQREGGTLFGHHPGHFSIDKHKIQIVIESDNYGTPITDEIACIQREDLAPETLGMTLAEAKDLLANIQAVMIAL